MGNLIFVALLAFVLGLVVGILMRPAKHQPADIAEMRRFASAVFKVGVYGDEWADTIETVRRLLRNGAAEIETLRAKQRRSEAAP